MTALRARHALSLLVVLLALTPAPARAQDWLIVPYLGLTFAGDSSLFADLERGAGETATMLGASVVRVGAGPIGFEGDFGYVPGFFERGEQLLVKPGSYVTSLTGSVILSLPLSITRESLRPYVVGGMGIMHAEAEEFLSTLPIATTAPVVVLGGGAMGFITNNVGVRFDLRHLRSLGRGDELIVAEGPRVRFWRGTIGLVFRY